MVTGMKLTLNCAYRTCINACATVDAAVVDYPLVARFADCAYRTGIITCSAVNALLCNGVSQCFHLLLGNSLIIFSGLKIAYGYGKV
jgi:hypothetical protein